MITSFINRFKDLYDKWDLSCTASNIRNELGGCRVVLNKLHYLKLGKRYEISGNYYDVTEIKGREVFFSFVGHNILIPSSFNLIKPKFFHGTIISTNNELKDIHNWRDKLPLLYLYEILTETRSRNKMEQLDVSADIRLFFLDSTESGQLHTETIYEDVISYQDDILECFIDYMYDSNLVKNPNNYNVTPITHFAKIEEQGYGKNLFTDSLSGLELGINIEFKKVLNCTC